MKLEDEFNQDEALAETWIEKHPGWTLVIVVALVFAAFAAVVF
jgi:hypothetical protein